MNIEPTATQEELTGVTQEVAVPFDPNSVQPTAQTPEQLAQSQVDGLGTVENQEAIPYERFKEINDKFQTSQQQLQMSQQQNQIYQNNLQQPQQAPEQSRLQQIAEKLNEVGDDESLYGKEAKEMVTAMQEEISHMHTSQQQNQQASFLAQNPDYGNLVVQNTVVGQQYAPEFIEMLNANPVAHQQLQLLEANPLQQQQAALTYAREYHNTKIAQQTQASPVGVAPMGAPPSLSAIPTPMGTSHALTSFQNMSNSDFLKMVDGTPKTL